MSLIQVYSKRIRKKVMREGAYNTFVQLLLRFESVYFDRKHGVDTHQNIALTDLHISTYSTEHARGYQPIYVRHLTRVLQVIQPTKDDVLIDFGSGKGRVLLISAQYPFKKVVGVEFSDKLCEIAEKNVSEFSRKNKICPIEIHCIDAGQYEIKKEETIFFFFNPFETEIRQKVIENIKSSYAKYPRKMKIVYINRIPPELEEGTSAFALTTSSTLNGLPFQVYETQ